MANNISDLYNQVINEHRKYPRNKGLIEGYKTLHLKNPSCGDDVTVQVEIKDGKDEVSLTINEQEVDYVLQQVKYNQPFVLIVEDEVFCFSPMQCSIHIKPEK